MVRLAMVTRIQVCKHDKLPTETLEAEIDKMFFGLYGLTTEERAIVANATDR